MNRVSVSVDLIVPADDGPDIFRSSIIEGLQSEWARLRHHYYLRCYFWGCPWRVSCVGLRRATTATTTSTSISELNLSLLERGLEQIEDEKSSFHLAARLLSSLLHRLIHSFNSCLITSYDYINTLFLFSRTPPLH